VTSHFSALSIVLVVFVQCCDLDYYAVGCYQDDINDRTMTELLLTDRDSSSPVYSGQNINWANWNQYIRDLVCRCAGKTRDKGYRTFGIQFYGKLYFIVYGLCE